jgi:uncharacterized protein YukE
MDKPECDSAYERLLAMLTACAQGAALSAGPVPSRVQSLDFMVKGFAAELAAESLSNQLDQIAQDVAGLKSDLDSMSELGEMASLRLQMAMDRMSKLMTTLSNVLKKISDTAEQITQNLK